MPTGLFRTADQSAQVEYDGVSIPIPRSTYEKNGYKPDFDKLPLEDDRCAGAAARRRRILRAQPRSLVTDASHCSEVSSHRRAPV